MEGTLPEVTFAAPDAKTVSEDFSLSLSPGCRRTSRRSLGDLTGPVQSRMNASLDQMYTVDALEHLTAAPGRPAAGELLDHHVDRYGSDPVSPVLKKWKSITEKVPYSAITSS
jgi:predicted metal-dependent hydrolase